MALLSEGSGGTVLYIQPPHVVLWHMVWCAFVALPLTVHPRFGLHACTVYVPDVRVA